MDAVAEPAVVYRNGIGTLYSEGENRIYTERPGRREATGPRLKVWGLGSDWMQVVVVWIDVH